MHVVSHSNTCYKFLDGSEPDKGARISGRRQRIYIEKPAAAEFSIYKHLNREEKQE